MPPALFVTGTDTGVGKTQVASLILRELLAQGVRAAGFKPVCSGAETGPDSQLFWDDLNRLEAAVEGRQTPEQICPQRFLAPLAPPLAAAVEHREVDVPAIEHALASVAVAAEALVIEGAGGWLCPLTADRTVADWVADWRFPVLIVARPGLGTINHTLLTIESIQRRDLRVVGVVLNFTSELPADESAKTNATEISRRTGVPVLGTLGFGGRGELRQGSATVRIPWLTLMHDVCQD